MCVNVPFGECHDVTACVTVYTYSNFKTYNDEINRSNNRRNVTVKAKHGGGDSLRIPKESNMNEEISGHQ